MPRLPRLPRLPDEPDPRAVSREAAPDTAALGWMALAAVLFAVMNASARAASSTASWASIGAVRAMMGALIALAVARARGESLVPADRRAVFLRSLFGTGAMVTTFYALSSKTLALGDTATLLNLTPVFLAVLAPIFLRERTTRGVATGIAVSLGGVVLVVRPAVIFGGIAPHATATTGPSASTTAVVALAAAFLAAIAMMLLRRVGQRERPEVIAAHFSIFASVVMLGFTALDPRLPRGRDIAFTIAAGTAAGFAQLAMTRAYSLAQAARVSGMGYLSVVTSACLGMVLLDERPAVTAVFGMVLVIAGGLIVTFTRGAGAR